MSREIFHDLLEKYQKGLCTDAERSIVEHWYGLLDGEEADVEPEELSAIEQRLWNKINGQISEDETGFAIDHPKRTWKGKKLLAIAALILVTSSFFVLFRQQPEDKNSTFLAENAKELRTVYNVGANSEIITLEDGSKVTLEPKASLTFPRHFRDSIREVSLTGDGFFLISKNPKRPFMVYNKHIVTRVLGTSFSIRWNPKTNETEVTVRTGKVLVTPNRGLTAIDLPTLLTSSRKAILVPNEKTTFNTADEDFDTTLADNPIPVSKDGKSVKEYSFLFNEARLPDVVASLTDTYGVEIILKTEALKDNTFTGDLSTLSLYNKLDFLCQSIDAHYRLEGTQIFIEKK
jgi:transmembrane sensor